MNYLGSSKLSEKVSLTYFALVNQNFGETFVGLSYTPKPWVSIGFAVGPETGGSGFRTTQNLLFFKGKHSLLSFTEFGKGKDNYFYRVIYNYKVSKQSTVGINIWRFHGIGPHFTYDLPSKLKSKVWISPLYDTEFKVARVVVGTTILM